LNYQMGIGSLEELIGKPFNRGVLFYNEN